MVAQSDGADAGSTYGGSCILDGYSGEALYERYTYEFGEECEVVPEVINDII